MTRHQVDLSMSYSYHADLPAHRSIEVAEVEHVTPTNPPIEEVPQEPYLPDGPLVEAVNLSIALGRPLLLQGDPGCGKTRLAYSVAYTLGLPLEVSYVKSTSRAQDLLYTYDVVRRLYDSQLKYVEANQSLQIENYIRLGPLGRAIARASYGRRSVVLIDEIDKADLDFPNDLLWELDRLEFKVHEAPQLHFAAGDDPSLRPIVIVTNNEEKPLPAAFLRRCIFHYLEFPRSPEQLEQILAQHRVRTEKLCQKAIQVLLQLRKMDLRKRPGLSELIDWVGYLEAVQTPEEQLGSLPYLGVLLKQQADQIQARKDYSPA